MSAHRRLPPLIALRAFEAVGKHLSFSKAADELAVSQSAVSHHIKHLEDELGSALFVRQTRSISLTPTGVAYLAVVRQAFDLIATGTRAARVPARAPVRVSLLSSFASNWLMQRLGRFSSAYPDIELKLEPSIALADVGGSGADVAIRYGLGGWPDVEARLFLREQITPVCSPALLAQGPTIDTPEDLLKHTILCSYSSNPFEWIAWCKAADVDLGPAKHAHLTDYNIVLQAALDGYGVAIGRKCLIDDKLRQGLLVAPFPDLVISADIGYWIVTPREGPSVGAEALIAWLYAEAAIHERDRLVA